MMKLLPQLARRVWGCNIVCDKGEEDYRYFHWESERGRKLKIMNKDSKSATEKDAARIGTKRQFWSRTDILMKVLLKISWHSWQLEGESHIQYRPCEAFPSSLSKEIAALKSHYSYL